MRSPNNDLHLLITSLSKDEKRYFKNYIKHWVKNATNYIKLFDAISRQKEYNEAKIKQKFRGETFTKQLSVSKNYLYNLLLNLLSNYHAQKSIEDSILQGLRHVKILYNKQLYALAKKELSKIKKQAALHEYFNYSKIIFNWELTIENNSSIFTNWTKEQLDLFFEELNRINLLELDLQKIFQLSSSFNFMMKKNGQFRNFKEQMHEIISHPLIENAGDSPSFRVKTKGLITKGIFHGLNGSYDKGLKYHIEALDTYDNNPIQLNEDRENYLKYLNNAIFIVTYIKDEALFQTFLDKYKKVQPSSPAEAYQLDFGMHKSILMYNFRRGNFRENIAYIPKVEAFIAEKSVFDMEYHYFMGLFSLQYFGIGDYQTALIYIEKIEANLRHDYQNHISFILILKLLIYYSMDELDLVEYSLRRLYYFLRKKNQLFEFEKFILKILRKVISISSQKELIAYFIVVRDKLTELLQTSTQKELEPYTYFNYRAWLESQITGKQLEVTAKEHSDYFP